MSTREPVPPGYKETKVGVIPEDWDASPVAALCALVNGRGFKPFEWDIRGYPIIRIQNLNGSDDFNYFSGRFDPKILVGPGQLLFAWSGSRGTSFGPHFWHGPTAVLNYHTWKVVTFDKKVDADFFFHALRHITGDIEDAAHGASALVHTQKREMETYLVSVPQSIQEQQAIAAALSDVDALIAVLDALIAKKRDIKQAAMQQLLTGKTRLPGFTGEWATKQLGDIANVVGGGTPKSSVPEYWDGGVPWCTPTDITATLGKYLSVTARTISPEGLKSSAARLLPVGALLLCTRATIGEIRIAGNPVCTNQGFKSLICNPTANNEFIYYKLSQMTPDLIEKSSGSTFLEISKKDVVGLEIRLPSIEEQSAIAEILSELDAELAALEAKRDKTRALKAGMMQELLTGRIRLL